MPSRKSFRFEQLGFGWDEPGLIAGVDEAGRGPLAGPVVAAAVILDELKPIKGLADSKVLTARKREKLFDEIRAKALCFAIARAKRRACARSASSRSNYGMRCGGIAQRVPVLLG